MKHLKLFIFTQFLQKTESVNPMIIEVYVASQWKVKDIVYILISIFWNSDIAGKVFNLIKL